MKKLPIILLSLGMVFATVGATSASWAVTDNADPFGIKISVSAPQVTHSVTFYMMYHNSTWDYPQTITVNDGETLTAPTLSKTDFTLKGWSTSQPSSSVYTPTYTTTTINQLPIKQDMTLYPIMESNTNKVWIQALGIVGNENSDITINSSSIQATKIGKEYVGVENTIPSPVSSWDTKRELHTASGIYKFTSSNGAATVLRKIRFKPNNGNWSGNWDGFPSFFIHSWGNSDSDAFLGNSKDSSGYLPGGYIDATNINFQIVRNSHNNTSSINWNSCNKSANLSFDSSWWWGGSGSNHYSSSTYTLNLWDDHGWDNWGSGNANWIS